MNGIILYQSKYGASRKYAMWLQEKTGFLCHNMKEGTPGDLDQFDTVIYIGGIYASGIAGISYLKRNWGILRDKKVVILYVCASPYDENAREAMKKYNLPELMQQVPVFYGRGAWDKENMSFKDRTLCGILQKAIAKKKPEELEPWMEALLEAGDSAADWTDPAYLEPVLNWIQG